MAKAGEWPAVPPPLVRIAGLPVTVLDRLRFPHTTVVVEAVVSARARLAARGATLAEALYPVIGATGAGSGKARLVGLRRALHGARVPAPAEWCPAVRAAVPAPLSQRIDGWLADRRRVDRLQARLPQVLAAEFGRKQEELRAVTADVRFRRALGESSPALAGELDRWLADPARCPRRATVARLAKYVARAATKTSPNSTFGVSGLGSWSTVGHPAQITSGADERGVLELYRRVGNGLRDGLLRQPRLWESAAVRVNPSALWEGDRVVFLGRPMAEPVLALPGTPALRHCLTAVEDGAATTLGGLRELLAAAGPGVTAATRFLRYLLDVGLLLAGPPAGSGSGVADQLATWVATHGGDTLADVAGAFRELAACLATPPPVTDLGAHRRRQADQRRTVAALVERLGTGAATPSTVAHDTVVRADPVARYREDAWRPALRDLRLLRQWLAGFDAGLPVRLALGECWGEWFGAAERVPFLRLHRMVQEAVREPARDPRAAELRRYLSGVPAGSSLSASGYASVRRLGDLRDRTLQPLRNQARREGGEIQVDPALLGQLASGWPAWSGTAGSLGCYVQPLPPGSGPSLVLEGVSLGYGRGRTRFNYLLTLTGASPDGARCGQGDGADPALAELAAPDWSTVNDRLPAMPYEIDYPAAVSDRPPSQRLPLNDLVVSYDPATGLLRLHSVRLGRQVRVLDLGLLMLPAQPPAARLLLLMFGWTPLFDARIWPDRAPAAPGVRKYSRIVAGRVVLRRASWVVDPAVVPARGRGETDADFLLRLTTWRREAGVPARCFVRALRPTGSAGAGHFDKSRKPIYLDFHNWLLVMALENVLRSPVRVLVFEEALPDPAGAAQAAGPRHAVGMIVEVGETEEEPC